MDMGSTGLVGMVIDPYGLKVGITFFPAVSVFPEDLIAQLFVRGVIL